MWKSRNGERTLELYFVEFSQGVGLIRNAVRIMARLWI